MVGEALVLFIQQETHGSMPHLENNTSEELQNFSESQLNLRVFQVSQD